MPTTSPVVGNSYFGITSGSLVILTPTLESQERIESIDCHPRGMMGKEKQAPEIALAPGVHFGDLTEMCDFGAWIVAESHYAPGFTTPWHTHVTASFTVILRGEYVEEHRAQSLRLFSRKDLVPCCRRAAL
jgi:hypothetical protein